MHHVKRIIEKISWVLFLSLIWCSIVNASCYDDIDVYTKYFNSKTMEKSPKENANYIVFDFKNKSKNRITILNYGLKSTGGTVMKEREPLEEEKHLKPFGKLRDSLEVEDLNLDVAGNAYYRCQYYTAIKKELKKEQKKSQSNSTKKKSDGGYNWWPAIIAGLFISLFAGMALNDKGTQKKENINNLISRNKSKSKSNKVMSDAWLHSIWQGEKSLGETFWLYYVLINGIASYAIATLFMQEHMWVFLIIAATNVFTSVAVWRSASNYKLIQVKKKQSNIWGILAKISVVLNIFQLGSTAILLLSVL